MGMPKSDRLLYILNLLRTRRNLNASRLAEECGVTERSIYRDIISLSEANVPIYYDHGYKLASNNFLPPLNFTLEEYACLRLALDSTPLKLSKVHKAQLKQIRAKIEANLPEQVRREGRFQPSATHIDITTTHEEEKAERYYGSIEKAVNECLCIEMDYDSLESGRTTRVVEPHFIIFRGRAFYFVAFCRLRRDFRTFRMDRVHRLTVTDIPFTPKLDIRPEDYFEGSWEIYRGEPVTVVVKLTGAAARLVTGSKHHANETIEPLGDDSVTYTVTVDGIEEISRWILGFGEQAEVLEPVSLRERLREIGMYFTRTYQSPPHAKK